jgi:hypothetical protein
MTWFMKKERRFRNGANSFSSIPNDGSKKENEFSKKLTALSHELNDSGEELNLVTKKQCGRSKKMNWVG